MHCGIQIEASAMAGQSVCTLLPQIPRHQSHQTPVTPAGLHCHQHRHKAPTAPAVSMWQQYIRAHHHTVACTTAAPCCHACSSSTHQQHADSTNHMMSSPMPNGSVHLQSVPIQVSSDTSACVGGTAYSLLMSASASQAVHSCSSQMS